jgi:two-component system sensor histidine kinase HydH
VHIHQAHGIYRRLYYFPIIFAAFLGGWWAGLGTALVVCAAYLPHAFGLLGRDPAPTLEKLLEMVLYLAVGMVTGLLVSREMATRRSLQRTAAGLRQALDDKARMEGELVRTARLAAVGRLSAGLAHEIRNPLASIKGAAELLADDIPPDDPKGRLLQVLVAEAKRLNTVLTRFLAFARPQAGRRENVGLVAELAQVAELLRHEADIPAVRVPADAAPDAWRIVADPEQVRQLLLNVLRNGAQAAGVGGHVDVNCEVEGTRLLCRIEDDGPGFTAEALENLATPFFTTKEGGSGLGLAISHRILEDLGGALSAENRPQGGARVTLVFPRAEEG